MQSVTIKFNKMRKRIKQNQITFTCKGNLYLKKDNQEVELSWKICYLSTRRIVSK